MSDTTTIEWTDRTWSPWEGCTKVGPGCDHCYAESMNKWLRAGENWGPGAPRRIYSEDHWEKPVKWQRNALKFETLHGRRQRLFPSVCDPFDNEAPPTLRSRLWSLIRLTPAIDYQLLTKRIGNVKHMLPDDWGDGYPNVWIGTTIVNREEMLRDAPKLKVIHARVRFWSVEPMLGPLGEIPVDLLPDWVIAGGESGAHARPSHPDWFTSLRDQCAAAGVPFLFKQWGEHAPNSRTFAEVEASPRKYTFVPAGNGAFYPVAAMDRVGKKAAGRLLDGVEHNGFPA